MPLLSDALQHHRVVIEGLAVHAMLHPDADDLKVRYKAPPLWLEIKEFEVYLRERHPDGPPKVADPRWVSQGFVWQSARNWKLTEGYFQAKLRDRESALLLDGLDEASPALRWRSFSKKRSACQCLSL